MRHWLDLPVVIGVLAVLMPLAATAQMEEHENWWEKPPDQEIVDYEPPEYIDDDEYYDDDWFYDRDWTTESDWRQDFDDPNWENDAWGDRRPAWRGERADERYDEAYDALMQRREQMERMRGTDWRDDARRRDWRDRYREERSSRDEQEWEDGNEWDEEGFDSFGNDYDMNIDEEDYDNFNTWYDDNDFGNSM